MPIPTAVSIELADDERSVLESWTRRHTSAQAPWAGPASTETRLVGSRSHDVGAVVLVFTA